MKEEIKKLVFRDIEYEVSNMGRVFKEGRELNQNTNADGYKVVWVVGNRNIGVHRFVAMAFIPNSDPRKDEVNHLDFDRENNRADNLEWVTHADNVRYSVKHGRYPDFTGEKNPNYGNTKLSEFYRANPDKALEYQSRRGTQNGRCQAILMHIGNQEPVKFDYIGQCATHLKDVHGFPASINAIRDGITKSIKRNGEYKGIRFERI